jgi:FlaA1/EpsC-like NDP-sugar epimerase
MKMADMHDTTDCEMPTDSGRRRTRHWWLVSSYFVLYDILAVNAAFFFALLLRFDFHFGDIPLFYLRAYCRFAPIYTVLCLAVFMACRLYQGIWRFASTTELLHCIWATALTGMLHIVGIAFFQRMPASYYIFGIILQFLLIVGGRFFYRFVLLLYHIRRRDSKKSARVMIIGAGSAGQLILRDIMKSDKCAEHVCCIIDDNRNKWRRYIDGVPIVGGRDSILYSVDKYDIDKIYLAIPSATPEQKRDILNICSETKCELKQLPGIYQLLNGEVTVNAMQKVSVEDLLGRAPIKTNLQEVYTFISGKVVLVTGGGGSIGSELCRQIAAHAPKQLIILDIYENNAYEIQLELKNRFPNLNLVTLIGSVRDSRRLEDVFARYRPDVVYHAAAHKHVPLMEDSPCESIKNNAIGTYKTAYAAMRYGCSRFVLISTDKAVNPTNIMGASKRLCEMVIQSFDRMIRDGRVQEIPPMHTHAEDMTLRAAAQLPQDVHTEFVAVRFGNVLGSNGSVIPLFKRQIANGGPVTVTHPDIIRYFMTIPEAVSLVLQAGVYAKGGEIFVLDMGSPVKIDTLARNLIRLSGYKPDVDIKIEYTGLRPGEKLYEEKLMAEEGLQKTENELIHIGVPIPFYVDIFYENLEQLMEAAYANREDIRDMVMKTVLTYHAADISSDNAEQQQPATVGN